MPSTSWFGNSVNYRILAKLPRREQGIVQDTDSASWGELKRVIHRFLKEFPCPSCGMHCVSGEGVQVDVGKVHLYEQVIVPGWFWGTRSKEVFDRTIWRLYGITIYMAPGRHIFNFFALADDLIGNTPGYLKCNSRGCSWKVSGGRYPTQSLGAFLANIKS